MIKTFLSIGLVLALCMGVNAQLQTQTLGNKKSTSSSFNNQATSSYTGPRIEITPFMGYQLNGKIKFREGDFKMEDAMSYGGMVSVEVHHQTWGEFVYSRSDTKASFRRFSDPTENKYNMAMNYFQLGVVREVGEQRIVPFGTFSGGVTWFQMKDAGVGDEVKLSLAMGGGLKFHLTDRIGLRFQGRLLLPLYLYGGGFYFGVGTGGPSSGLSLGSTVIAAQGDFTGGLIFRIGE
jgi:hypothetical protein